MNKKVRWITETALLLALLIALQYLTKPMTQLVTGSCVNAILAIAALFAGMGSGLTVALISPVLAALLGIAPNWVVVPAIMAGNAVYVVLLAALCKGDLVRRVGGWLIAAAAKFAALYLLVAQVICGLAATALMGTGLLKEPMLKMLPTMFSWPQLFTALIGGAVALAIAPVLKKALHR